MIDIPESECPDVWIRLPRHKWATSRGKVEDPVVPLERNLYGHPLARLLCERQFEEALFELGWEKTPNWECMLVYRNKVFFLSVYVDDIKMAGEKQNMALMWKKYMKKTSILTNPHLFIDHVYLGPNETIIEQYTKMFESRICAGATEKSPGWQTTSHTNDSAVLRHGRTCSKMC